MLVVLKTTKKSNLSYHNYTRNRTVKQTKLFEGRIKYLIIQGIIELTVQNSEKELANRADER